jgi:hypothetical protein
MKIKLYRPTDTRQAFGATDEELDNLTRHLVFEYDLPDGVVEQEKAAEWVFTATNKPRDFMDMDSEEARFEEKFRADDGPLYSVSVGDLVDVDGKPFLCKPYGWDAG